jgi:hypothetical protein
MKMVVVVGHFKENLDWLSQLNHPYIIYNKNPNKRDKFQINMPNQGYDSAVYLQYIIDNYDKLPEFVCFSQDNPFPHCSNFLTLVNNFDFKTEFLTLGITYIRDVENILKTTTDYADKHGIPYTLPIKFTSGNQYIISKNLILKNSLDFYKKILSTIMTGQIITETNYTLEYLFPTIFHFNSYITPTFK